MSFRSTVQHLLESSKATTNQTTRERISDVFFRTENLVSYNSNTSHQTVRLHSFYFYNDFYGINSGNNKFSIGYENCERLDIILPPAHVTPNDLACALNMELRKSVESVTGDRAQFIRIVYDENMNRMQMIATMEFCLYNDCSMLASLGFETTADLYSEWDTNRTFHVLVGVRAPDLNGPESLIVSLNPEMNCNINYVTETRYFCSIPVYGKPSGYVLYENQADEVFLLPSQYYLDGLHVTIKDKYGNFVHFQGRHWTMILQVDLFLKDMPMYENLYTFLQAFSQQMQMQANEHQMLEYKEKLKEAKKKAKRKLRKGK